MFKGIITPIVTPFMDDDNQSIDYVQTEALVNHLIDKGVDGIFILGSNGEFHVIEEFEKLTFAKKVVEVVKGRVPVFAGTGMCSTNETIRLSKAMEKIGVDALSVITPYFIKPTEDELYNHFKLVSESVNIPIVLYNIPKVTGCPITADVLGRLCELENIHAIKDSSGDMANLSAYIEACEGSNVSVLVGSDSKILEAYKLGATGAIAGTSNVITEHIINLDRAFNNNDLELAQKLQEDVDVLRGVLPLGTVPSIMKRSVELAGIAKVGPARRPVSSTTVEVDDKIKKMLAFYNLV